MHVYIHRHTRAHTHTHTHRGIAVRAMLKVAILVLSPESLVPGDRNCSSPTNT